MEPVIVVGVDGSSEAEDAFHWAVNQSRLTGATLHVVYAWDPAAVVALGVPPLVDWKPLEEAAAAVPANVVRKLLPEPGDIHIETSTVRGSPARVLVDASEEAEMLVIGSRGLGGFKGMLLGSVGHHCAAHAHCPVVIVHRASTKEKHVVRRETLHAH